jgi:Flp pilus assembly CpaE family ATPase
LVKKAITVLLIEDTTEYAELVQRWLSGKSDVTFVLNWTDSLKAGIDRLARGGVDVILLDLGLPDSQGLGTFTTTRAHAGGVPIILLSGSDTESLALEMMREGAQDYIVKSSCTAEVLVKAIQYAVLRSSSHAAKTGVDATAIGVIGAAGGVGTSTVACSLALELRSLTDQAVLLADLDVNAGLVSFLMNTKSEYTILDAATNVGRLDISFWEGMVAQGPGGLQIVGSPGLLGAAEADADKLRDVLAIVRAYYRWIVVDLGRLTTLSMSLMDRVNELFLVTTTSLPALYEARRAVAALMKAGIEADRLRLVVNQEKDPGGFNGAELSRMLGIPVYARLPDAGRELAEACAQGKFLPKTGDFREQIASLARRVAALPEPKQKGKIAKFLSFGNKPRPAGAAPTNGVAAANVRV